uniref:Protein kinase domain-containing protein n=1 Tax=Cyclophora tenuis TaxID=216820 RepID=A0A7S1GKX9_CYCTE
MYASLRVHQSKDYSRRDDMWSVLYVFCDLISGGLPWMSYAANRDREMCQKIKEQIHGTPDQTERMLMGETYHIAKYKRDMMEKEGKSELPHVPLPLAISKDVKKIDLLRKAFSHLASLQFADKPNYELLRDSLHGFLELPLPSDDVPLMEWHDDNPAADKSKRHSWDWEVPLWKMGGIDDPIDEDGDSLWKEAELQMDASSEGYNDASDMAKLPVEFQFRVAQMEYHSRHSNETPPHIALQDWMKCALPLVYGDWNSSKFERGNHRTNDDGFRREVFLKIVEKCLKCASRFSFFRCRSCYYDASTAPEKRRKISCSLGSKVAVSRALTGLREAKANEVKKRFAPPPTLSFSQP